MTRFKILKDGDNDTAMEIDEEEGMQRHTSACTS